MKILYYHQHFSTPRGSIGTRSYEFSKKLISKGHEVTIICGRYENAHSGLNNKFIYGKREGVVDNIKIVELDIPYSNSLNFIKRAIVFIKFSVLSIKIALFSEYDLLIATSTPLTIGIPGLIAKIFRGKPFIFEVRDLWPELPRAMGVIKNPLILKTLDILESVIYKNSTACIGLSPGIIEGIKKKNPNKNSIMIPNGCDLDLVKYKYKSLKQNITAAFTGAHGYANGLNSVLDVAKFLIQDSQTQISFQFIGDGILKNSLIERSKKEHLANCTFLDPKPKTELFSYLNSSVDIGLMILDNIPAFYFGTSPNKFFDYISLGLPVIVNYPGWIANLIKDNNCGIAVSPGDTEEFANALLILNKDKDLYKTMSKNARSLAIKKFDRNLLGDKFIKFVESIV